MLPRQLFEAHLDLIERTIDRVCRRAGVFGADAEDFASSMKIALLEDDSAILRSWRQESSLATFLAVVVRRHLADEQIRSFGRWRPSAEAKRLGEAAVAIETLVHRRGRSIDEVLAIVRGIDASLTRERVEQILAQLPQRAPRPRLVELDEHHAEVFVAPESAEIRALSEESNRIARQTAAVVRATLAQFGDEDQALIRLRFESGMSVADIARMMRLPQRPLYRRMESLLAQLRAALAANGIDASSLSDVLAWKDEVLDFGLSTRKEAAHGQTKVMEES